ncbi:MAG TPA: methyltransferase domain-containing protein [Nitratifractor sp.]|nr:methyltransferase domain-containing protein [Nitratifractor sp.]HHD74346.1 methyltransferase domain-containing protein [Nitratifractor sp.]
MAVEDREKWESKYSQNQGLLERAEPSLMVKKYYALAPNKEALDLACGGGRHALFLEGRGFSIDAVDISPTALAKVKERSKGAIDTIEADLDAYQPKSNHYGLIVKTNFLDRALIERAKGALQAGGVFIVETYIEDKENQKPNSNSNFLLKKDELTKIFQDGFEVLEYKTFWNESYEKYKMRKAAIAARRL